MIYIENHTEESFEFAFSNDKNAKKEDLNYKISATDTAESGANYIAYADESIYNMYFAEPTYLWARTLEGTYFVEGIQVELTEAITDNDVELANNITKRISVDTTQSFDKPAEMINGVETTRTVGKVVIKEEGTTSYQLVKIQENSSYSEFMKLATQIANGKVEDNFYAKLEITNQFLKLYKELVPEENDSNWKLVENGEILQPEEAKEDEQYILWLKNKNNSETKLDAQFLTCFDDYKPKVISEKIVTKLPVTADDPTLFIVLAILVIALIITTIVRIVVGRKETSRKTSKH